MDNSFAIVGSATITPLSIIGPDIDAINTVIKMYCLSWNLDSAVSIFYQYCLDFCSAMYEENILI